MGKRIRFTEDGDTREESPHSKRRRLETEAPQGDFFEPITARSISQLLSFQPDVTSMFSNIERFSTYLASISQEEKTGDREKKLSILKQFIVSISSENPAGDVLFLGDMLQILSFGIQNHHDHLSSTVLSSLALLLQVMSGILDLRNFGIGLCKSLLRDDTLSLIEKALSNPKKEVMVLACLRVLSEVVSFDGGVVARSVFAKRNITFRGMEILLGIRGQSKGNRPSEAPPPSLRRESLRYLTACFRRFDSSAKSEIVSQGKLIRAMFLDIREDTPENILLLLDSLRSTIVQDESVPRATKSRLLTEWMLTRVLSLHEYSSKGADPETRKAIQSTSHNFLTYVCTTLDQGILLRQNGWYAPDATSGHAGEADRSAEGIEKAGVRNTTLLSFIQVLRPYASVLQKQLLVSIFLAAPELVAPYFRAKKSFSLEPKLSSTWIGYSTFLFTVIQLPPPEPPRSMAVASTAPSTAIVLDSILPLPLTKKILTRCLNQSSSLISFLATRLMIASFQKLKLTMNWVKQNLDQNTAHHFISDLVAEYQERCPDMSCVITAFRSCRKDQSLQYEALSRLLFLQYQITPQLALEQRFDIALVLVDNLSRGTKQEQATPDHLCTLKFNNLLEIACRSPAMRWWQHPDSLPYSPFTMVLRSQVSASAPGKIYHLLSSIVATNSLLQQDTIPSALAALLISLVEIEDSHDSNHLYRFLDQCILRTIKKAVKYRGDIDLILRASSEQGNLTDSPVSILWMAILEQWPFFLAEDSHTSVAFVLSWLGRYLHLSLSIGESSLHLEAIRNELSEQTKQKLELSTIQQALDEKRSAELTSKLCNFIETIPVQESSHLVQISKLRPDSSSLHTILDLGPSTEPSDHTALSRWRKKDLSDSIDDGTISELATYLYSQHAEIRIQALAGLRTIVRELPVSQSLRASLANVEKKSGHTEWQQIQLLLGELVESIDGDPAGALPCFTIAMVTHCLPVLTNPLHAMYDKVNRFLNQGPRWELARLPRYWINKILLQAPTDDFFYRELLWLLDILLEGLRTEQDVDIYRQCQVFERLMALGASRWVSIACVKGVIKILYRCALVGGSTTMVTRCGVLSWLDVQLSAKGELHTMYVELSITIKRLADDVKLLAWGGSSILKRLR